MQRFLKKHARLDEEKMARQMEMRRSGLPVGRKVDIPFGVRAIQSGVEVDGIWISLPGTPNETSSPGERSSLTLEPELDLRGKEKARAVSGGVHKPTTTVIEVQPTPKVTPGSSPRRSPAGSLHEQETATATPSRNSSFGPPSSNTYRPKPAAQRLANITSNETLHVEATAAAAAPTSAPPVETYRPTTSLSSVRSASSSNNRTPAGGDRTSSSSDEGGNGRARHYVPHQQQPPPSAAAARSYPLERVDYFSPPLQPTPRSEPLAASRPTPVRTYHATGGGAAAPAVAGSAAGAEDRGATLAQPPAHRNTASRRVNAGFEVLPAGTFGEHQPPPPPPAETRRTSAHKLQRKGRERSSSRDS
ncbi:hypothetical protein F4780DRAFT_720605 [Xylariomycetidae sp. FL0641]|nr:hypothetical protein F4780DRAFT_720605 [Xylariomycetidae sp. FL0641]